MNEKGSPESEPAFGVRATAYPRVRGGGGGEGGEQPRRGILVRHRFTTPSPDQETPQNFDQQTLQGTGQIKEDFQQIRTAGRKKNTFSKLYRISGTCAVLSVTPDDWRV